MLNLWLQYLRFVCVFIVDCRNLSLSCKIYHKMCFIIKTMSLTDINCPSMNSVAQATHLLNSICPSGIRIVEVEPITSGKKPFCCWRVRYTNATPATLYAVGQTAKADAFNLLTRRIPMNTFVHHKARSEHPPSYIVTYGVRCDCSSDFSKKKLTPTRRNW